VVVVAVTMRPVEVDIGAETRGVTALAGAAVGVACGAAATLVSAAIRPPDFLAGVAAWDAAGATTATVAWGALA
jgi:outer membrane lipoprotein SlyB